MRPTPPKLSVSVIVPSLTDCTRSTGYGGKRRLRRGDRVVEVAESLFSGILTQLQRDHPRPL